jgi:tRNA G18 (ribose-2'-O)-methylase SpoU
LLFGSIAARMLHTHYLEEFDRPELEPYRTLRRRKDMARLDQFVVEGEKCVRRLLDSRTPYAIESLLLTPEWLLKLRAELEVRPEEIHAYVASHREIEEFTGFTVYQDLKVTARLLQPHTLPTVLEQTPRPWLFVACDELANAENMGTVIRNTAAFGGQALLVGETSTSPLLTRTIRASMGTIFDLPFVYAENLVNALKDLKWQGVRTIGAHAHPDRKTIGDMDFRGDVCLVFGSEGHGLSTQVQAVCDDLVLIPMAGKVDSLNVGSSVAVFLYEVARQRRTM